MIETEFICYKIRDRNTGLFSKGGNAASVSWNEQGKVWSRRGPLLAHLAQFKTGHGKSKRLAIPESWEVVPFVARTTYEDSTVTIPAREMYAKTQEDLW